MIKISFTGRNNWRSRLTESSACITWRRRASRRGRDVLSMLSLNPATNKIKYKPLKKIVVLTSKMARKYSVLVVPFFLLIWKSQMRTLKNFIVTVLRKPMISISYEIKTRFIILISWFHFYRSADKLKSEKHLVLEQGYFCPWPSPSPDPFSPNLVLA